MNIEHIGIRRVEVLDLSVTDLFGWENPKEKLKVDRYVDELLKGANFPPVPVVELANDTYSLTPRVYTDRGFPDGGHHRSIAHWKAGVPLLVNVVSLDWALSRPTKTFNIRDIWLM